jgi:hypothetical protein
MTDGTAISWQNPPSGVAITLGTANGLSLSEQTLSLGLASSGVTGALSGTDWNTFNGKQPQLNGIGLVRMTGTTVSYDNNTYLTGTKVDSFNTRTGAVTLTSSDVTTALNYTPYNSTNPAGYTTNLGTVTFVSALTLGTTGTDLSSTVVNGTTTPVITLNVPTASASNRGALSSADWITFNSKQAAYTLLTTFGSLANAAGFLKNDGTGVLSYDDTPQNTALWGSVTGASAQEAPAGGWTGNHGAVNMTALTATTGTFSSTITGTSFNGITGLASATPLMDGTAEVGTSTLVARQDHVHPVDTSRQAQLNGTGFVKVSGTTVYYDNSTYLTDGNTVRSGAVDPVATDGSDGDFWINTTSHFIFGPKTAGAWPAGVSLVGPAGSSGSFVAADTPPTFPDPWDDEFTTDTGPNGTGAWSWLNQGSSTYSIGYSSLLINAPAVSGDQLRCLVKPFSDSGSWTITSKVAMQSHGIHDYNQAGLVFGNSTTGKMLGLSITSNSAYASGISINLTKFNNTSSGAGAIVVPEVSGQQFYLRLSSDGTNLTASYSVNGDYFQSICTTTIADWLGTIDEIGLYVNTNDSSNPVGGVFGWIRKNWSMENSTTGGGSVVSGGSGLVLLEQHTASNSTSLDFTTAFTSTYDDYVMELVGIIPTTDGAVPYLRCSNDGGSTWDTSSVYTGNEMHAGPTGGDSFSYGAQGQWIFFSDHAGSALSSSALPALVGSIHIYDLLSTSKHKRFVFDGIGVYSLNGEDYVVHSSGKYANTTGVNALRFAMSSGNIASGTIRVYGIATSSANGVNGATGALGIIPGGTTGQVLGKLSATDYDVAWINQTGGGSGGLVLLEKHTASNSATLDFKSFISSTYDEYAIEVLSLRPDTNNVNLFIQMSTDGGATWDTASNYTNKLFLYGAGVTGYADTLTGIVLNYPPSAIRDTAPVGVKVSLRLFLSQGATDVVTFIGNGIASAQDNNNMWFNLASYYNIAGASVNAIRFIFSSGNIASGIIRVYGIAK